MDEKYIIYSDISQLITSSLQPITTLILHANADVDSVIVTSDDGKYLPFSYEPVPKPGTLIQVIAHGMEFRGELININDNYLSLRDTETSGIHKIYKYDSLRIDEEENLYPSIRFVNPVKPVVNYMFSGLTWKCVGVGFIQKDHLSIQISAIINNQTHKNLTGTFSLMDGDIYKNETYQNIRSKDTLQSSQEEYISYDLGKITINTNPYVVNIFTLTAPFSKIYTHILGEENVNFGYRFTTSKYLPPCRMTLYSSNKGSLLGISNISRTCHNKKIDLLMGSTVKISIKSYVNNYEQTINQKRPDGSNTETKIRVSHIHASMKNNKNTMVRIILKFYIGKAKLFDITCKQYDRFEDGYIEWHFDVPPALKTEQEHLFDCQVKYPVTY